MKYLVTGSLLSTGWAIVIWSDSGGSSHVLCIVMTTIIAAICWGAVGIHIVGRKAHLNAGGR
jgi:hypothetical protein